jgi:ribose-phosphate pyrophosphokinase
MSMEGATTTVEATRLPGLEVSETKPEVRPEHWIERGPSKRLMLFSGRSHPALAGRIAEELQIELGEVDVHSFASGETYCRFEESIRGADLFIVQTSSPAPDQHLMELLIMIDAAKLASARRITAVLPLYPYSRQDKKSRPRESITAKLVAEMIQAAGADRVLTMDLHAGQVQGFFQIPVDHMTALPMLAQYFRDLRLPEELVAVAPDTGRTRLASKFAEMIGGDLAVLQKDRPAHNVARVTNIIGDVKGKCAVMTDDMIDTAGTLVAGAEFLKQSGAKHVFACATHGIFSAPALERIAESPLDRVVVTDTVPVDPRADPERIRVLPVAGILAQTIHNIFADDSVSAIFGDMNALF